MPNYELSPTTEKDIQQVTRYTLNKWGSKSLEKYITGLKATFDAIGNGDALKREFSKRFPTVLVTKYRYHSKITDTGERALTSRRRPRPRATPRAAAMNRKTPVHAEPE